MCAELKACARDQRRLPDAGELAHVFDHLGAVQPQQWVASYFVSGGFEGAVLGQNSSRDLLIGGAGISQPEDFRCVTSATN